MKTTILIPARLASTRLPEKALADIFGKSLIMHVYSQAKKVKLAHEVYVATDHHKIFDHVVAAGGKAIMTSPHHISGTDRIAEVAAGLDSDLIINVQGDEPIIHPAQIEQLISWMVEQRHNIATQCQVITDDALLFDYNVVKVVKNTQHKALYFSRQAIPAVREYGYDQWMKKATYYRHIGLYGYQRQTLLSLTKLPESPLEKAENLEQLRWLDHGFEVFCQETDYTSIGVDTEEDLEKVRDLFFREMLR